MSFRDTTKGLVVGVPFSCTRQDRRDVNRTGAGPKPRRGLRGRGPGYRNPGWCRESGEWGPGQGGSGRVVTRREVSSWGTPGVRRRVGDGRYWSEGCGGAG